MATADSDNADDKNKDGKSGEDKPAAGDDKGKGGSGGGDAPKTYTQAELDAALAADRQDRKRAAKSKGEKPAAKGKGKEDEGEDSEELAKERQRREQVEQQLRVRDARDSVESAAKTAGFQNPGKIYRLIKDEIEFDDSGKPENVKDLITIAKRDFPEELTAAKGKGSADGGAGAGASGGAGGGGDMNTFIRNAAGRK